MRRESSDNSPRALTTVCVADTFESHDYYFQLIARRQARWELAE